MSLERFRRTKLVTLNRQSKAYQAARAMADNHIGAVLVSDPKGLAGIVTDRDLALAVLGHGLDPTSTALSEFMSEDVVACDVGSDLVHVVKLMQEHGVRRIPITDGGRAVGLITLDDLVAEGAVDAEALRAIVTAQLEVEAPHKPAGLLHPQGASRKERRAAGRAHALARAKARAQATYDKLVAAVAETGKLDRVRAERALTVGVCMLCRRFRQRRRISLWRSFRHCCSPASSNASTGRTGTSPSLPSSRNSARCSVLMPRKQALRCKRFAKRSRQASPLVSSPRCGGNCRRRCGSSSR
jgi:CBS domain-containing protein